MNLLSWSGPLFALVEISPAWNWPAFGWHLFLALVYVVVGLALFAVAYLIIDKVTPFSLGQELLEKKNTAVAIALGCVFLGIALIVAAAIR